MKTWLALGISALLMLNACTSLPTNPLLQQQQAQLAQLDAWQLTASIAAKSRDQGWQARLLWRYRPQSYYLRINAPLGQGAFSLERYADGTVSLKSANGQSRQAQNAQSLLKDELGLNLPLSALPYWIKGQIAPNIEVQQQSLDAQGHLTQLEQDGWHIEYSDYRNTNIAGKSYQLPHKLLLKQNDYFAKIAISTLVAHP